MQVYHHIRQSCGRIEHGKQPFSQIICQRNQTFVAGELITRKQSAEQSDGYLEVLDVNVTIEREIVRDQFTRFIRLRFQLHQN